MANLFHIPKNLLSERHEKDKKDVNNSIRWKNAWKIAKEPNPKYWKSFKQYQDAQPSIKQLEFIQQKSIVCECSAVLLSIENQSFWLYPYDIPCGKDRRQGIWMFCGRVSAKVLADSAGWKKF